VTFDPILFINKINKNNFTVIQEKLRIIFYNYEILKYLYIME